MAYTIITAAIELTRCVTLRISRSFVCDGASWPAYKTALRWRLGVRKRESYNHLPFHNHSNLTNYVMQCMYEMHLRL